MVSYLKDTVRRFLADDCTTQAAALAYYTTFSLPSLLLIVVAALGMVFGRQAVRQQIESHVGNLIGPGAAGQVATMVQNAGAHSGSGSISVILGSIALALAATAALAQLQSALNRVWHVQAAPDAGLRSFIGKRVASLLMIMGIAVVFLATFLASYAVAAFGGVMTSVLPSLFSEPLLRVLELLVSGAILTLVFAAIFKVLPDAMVGWKQVWPGAIFTAVLFTIGKYLIGLYLGRSGTASVYGAAGSLILIVLWIYYSSIILLLGAEFTRVWADRHGMRVRPERGAVVVEEVQHPRAA